MPGVKLYTIIQTNTPISSIYLLGTVVGAVLRQASPCQITQSSSPSLGILEVVAYLGMVHKGAEVP